MKGLQLLLQSLGIKIDPVQIEEAFNKGKDALPELARQFELLNARLMRMEAQQRTLITVQNECYKCLALLMSRTGEVQPDPVHEEILSIVSPEKLREAFERADQRMVIRDA
jgi:hypothetical protein